MIQLRICKSIYRAALAALVWAVAFSSLLAADPVGKQHMYIGTYTNPDGQRPVSQGIYHAIFDPATGKMTSPELAAAAENPSFLNIHPNQKFLYAVSKEGQKDGGVLSFAIDRASGKLTPLGKVAACGDGPCHLVVDRSGKCVLVASYGSGTVAAMPILPDGSLGDAAEIISHRDGSKPGDPHAHSVHTDLANRFVVVPELGLDQLRFYDLNADQAKLTKHDPPFLQLKEKSGPRHFAFHPNGKFAYGNMETTSMATAFAYDPEKQTLTEIDSLSTLPSDFKENNSTAEIQIHPSGKFLYVSNRGHNSIAIFGIDPSTGKLTALGHQSTLGKTPAQFLH